MTQFNEKQVLKRKNIKLPITYSRIDVASSDVEPINVCFCWAPEYRGAGVGVTQAAEIFIKAITRLMEQFRELSQIISSIRKSNKRVFTRLAVHRPRISPRCRQMGKCRAGPRRDPSWPHTPGPRQTRPLRQRMWEQKNIFQYLVLKGRKEPSICCSFFCNLERRGTRRRSRSHLSGIFDNSTSRRSHHRSWKMNYGLSW